MPEDFEAEGLLAKDSAKVVMKALYGARFVRFDLLWPIGDCARHTSKWPKAYDRRLDRLMGHLKGTLDYGLEGFVGDSADKCSVLCYCDASSADELRSSKSTSGLFVAIVGPNTFAPSTALCKKQTCVSHSSTESERGCGVRGADGRIAGAHLLGAHHRYLRWQNYRHFHFRVGSGSFRSRI